MEQDLTAILARLDALESENKFLKEQVAGRNSVPQGRDDPSLGHVTGDKFARRVVMETSPGAAEEYAQWSGTNKIINPGGLVQNSARNPMKDEE